MEDTRFAGGVTLEVPGPAIRFLAKLGVIKPLTSVLSEEIGPAQDQG